ncbi:MAG: hypothetical protein LBT97_14155 [Planctomycetota bacterium]|jgi:uncharacterized protein YfaS (alpha-2-macroglobulin family)|nr:hypothetical protein [Planctomycetota bacterium]
MKNDNGVRRSKWPPAFFLLNLGAIGVWFALFARTGDRELQLVRMTPSGAEVKAEEHDEIVVEFSRPLDPESIDANSLRIRPALPGKAEPAGPNAIRFRPETAIAGATTYTIILSPRLRGRKGELPPRELLEFSTARFAFDAAAPVAFDKDSYTVELAFNQPIRAADLERAIGGEFSRAQRRGGGSNRVTVLGGSTSRKHRVRIGENRSSLILLTLPAGLTGDYGPLGLEKDVRLLFRIAGGDPGGEEAAPPWAHGLEPVTLKPELAFLGMNAEWDGATGSVRVRTTAPLDMDKARGFVSVDPAVPVTFAAGWDGLGILGPFEPGKQYSVTLKAGFPAGEAGKLPADISRRVWFDDMPAAFAFAHGGGFLAPDGLLKVPVSTRNVPELTLGVRKLYPGNLVETLLRDYGDEVETAYSEPEFTKKIDVAGQPNREVETLLDLREIIGGKPSGVYGLEIWRERRRWRSESAVVAITDLGLSGRLGRDHVLAWAMSLAKGEPAAGTTVTVYSNRRQLLGKGVTGESGTVEIALPALPEGEKAALLVAERGEDLSYVRFERDLKPRGGESARGDGYTATYDLFLATERGVYRGGEKVLVSGLLRDADLRALARLPLVVRLTGPDGKVRDEIRAVTDSAGRVAFEASTEPQYAGGLYQLAATLPGQKETLGKALFTLADYIPETLEVAMELGESESVTGSSANIKVRRLAGGGAEGIPLRVLASYRPAPFRPEGWDDWQFGDSRIKPPGEAVRREFTATTDASGASDVAWDNPSLALPAAMLMAVRAEASEPGGRTTSATASATLHNAGFYLGVKEVMTGLRGGESRTVPIAALSPDGTPSDKAAGWKAVLYRVEFSSLLRKRSDGALVYDWVRRESPEAEYAGSFEKGRSELTIQPIAGGGYRLAVDAPGGAGVTSDFHVSGPGASWYGEDPEILEVRLDKNRYQVGDSAALSVSAPFAGMALVAVETDRALSHRLVDFVEGENRVEIPVTAEMRPNAHVSATLVRPVGAEPQWKPHRVYGAARLDMDNLDRRLEVALDTPPFLSPGGSAEITVAVARDGKPVPGAAVTLWGVDEGVLSLTGYKTPSPWEHFTRTRRLSVWEADMYSRLAPELEEWRNGKDPSPGGSEGYDSSRSLNQVTAERVKAAVVFSGDLVADANGRATAKFIVPEFAGELRVMAWAAEADGFGSEEKSVEVKAPAVVLSSWPRFAAPGDSFRVALTVINRSGKDGVAALSCETDDGLDLKLESADIPLGNGEAKTVYALATAMKTGAWKATAAVTMDGETYRDRVELPVRPPALFARSAGIHTVRPGEEVSFTVGSGLLAAGAKVKVMAGSSPELSLTGAMETLLDYPYDCGEQTVSRLAALAFLPDLLALSRPGQVESGEIEALVKSCLARLALLQAGNGGIRMWPNDGDPDFALSAQALYMIAECRAAGFTQAPEGIAADLAEYLGNALDRRLSDGDSKPNAGESEALACLALARFGERRRSALLQLEELAQDNALGGRPFTSPALAFIAEAFAAAGAGDAAVAFFDKHHPGGVDPGMLTDKRIALSAWVSAGLAAGLPEERLASMQYALVKDLNENAGGWNTRECFFVLTALGKYYERFGAPRSGNGLLTLDGEGYSFPIRQGKTWNMLPTGTRVEGRVTEGDLFHIFWTSEGTPENGEVDERDQGISARRSIRTIYGMELDDSSRLVQGEVYEVRIRVAGQADDLVLVDLLPAGLEIENPRLNGREAGLETPDGFGVDHVDIRDDRILVFGSVSGFGEFRYLVRAVTPGEYVWPAHDASRMYDGSVYSVHGRGRLEVAAKKDVIPAE